MVVHSKARNTFSGPAGRQQRASVPVLARGGRHAGRGSGLGLVDIVRDGGRWSSRTGGPRTQAPACCHAHRDPAGGASSIRSSCPGSVAAGAGDPPPALPRPGAGALGAGPLDDRVQQAITGQQRPTPGHWPRRRLAAFPYLGQRGSTASRSAALPGRAQEAGRKIPDHHTQPGLAPSHYRTAPSEISGPSDPGSAAVRSGRADAARATRHPPWLPTMRSLGRGQRASAGAAAATSVDRLSESTAATPVCGEAPVGTVAARIWPDARASGRPRP